MINKCHGYSFAKVHHITEDNILLWVGYGISCYRKRSVFSLFLGLEPVEKYTTCWSVGTGQANSLAYAEQDGQEKHYLFQGLKLAKRFTN